MDNPINILIVDDHPLFRQGLRDLVETDPRFRVVGEAGDGETALDRVAELQPDVVILDINMPGMNGLQVTRELKDTFPEIRVVMVTGYDDSDQMLHAFHTGASAYCAKDITPEALVRIVHAAHDGYFATTKRTMTAEELHAWMAEAVGQMPGFLPEADDGLFEPLTPRQMEVLEMVTAGLSNREIAFKLDISHQTVKNHMTAILRKLNCQDRTQAAVYALSHGWIQMDNSDTHPGNAPPSA